MGWPKPSQIVWWCDKRYNQGMSASIESQLTQLLGPNGIIDDSDGIASYQQDWRGNARGKPRLVARPSSTAEVAEIVKLCRQDGIGIVPQGGNTGLCRGALADNSGSQIVVNLSRMNRIRALDPVNFTVTVESGAVLKTIQQAADDADCLFPLSLGAEGSCQIGGNISTNAGGTGVLRYGNTRALVLGLEVVLPDGRIWDGLRALGKDNTGYDLKHMFIGAEGSLGIVTAAVLKLFPKPRDMQTAFCGLTSLEAALALLARARATTGDQVSAFELMPRRGLELDFAKLPGMVDPLAAPHEWYVLTDIAGSQPGGHLRQITEEMLAEAIEAGEVADAVIAESIEQRKALWRLREEMPEALKLTGNSLHHDVAVPTSMVPALIRRASEKIESTMPGVRCIPFGHVGDGNIHFSIIGRPDDPKGTLARTGHGLTRIIFDVVAEMRGSFSAEHGVGSLKLPEMATYKSEIELDLMRRIKAALDPEGIMNPGKVVTKP